MNTNKTTARIVGVLFLTATVTYILGSGLIESILNAPDYLMNVFQNESRVVIGVLLEFIDAAAVVVIGVLLFPVLKKHNEAIAIGYVGARIIECILLIVAGVSLLLLIPLSQGYVQAGASNAAYFQISGTLFMAESGLAFQVAMIALGLGSLPFCYLLYRSKLVPRAISVLGLIGYAALIASGSSEIFGYSIGMVLFLPGALFEIAFPIWLIVKGFNSSAIVSESAKTDSNESEQMSLSTA